MNKQTTPEIIPFNLSVTDAYGGAAHVLIDAQRFGLVLSDFNVSVEGEGHSAISLSVVFPNGVGRSSIQSRMARHPTVMAISYAGARTTDEPVIIAANDSIDPGQHVE